MFYERFDLAAQFIHLHLNLGHPFQLDVQLLIDALKVLIDRQDQ